MSSSVHLCLSDYEDDDDTTAMSLGYDKNDYLTDEEENFPDETPPLVQEPVEEIDDWNEWNEFMEESDLDNETNRDQETENDDSDDTCSVATVLCRYKPKIIATSILADGPVLRTKNKSSKRSFWTRNYKNKKGLVLYVLLSGYFIYCVHMMYYFYALEKMFMCCCSCYFAAFTFLFLMDKNKFFPYKQRNMSFF
jgi:hypothetical protein